jgi:hypothetical protein
MFSQKNGVSVTTTNPLLVLVVQTGADEGNPREAKPDPRMASRLFNLPCINEGSNTNEPTN